MVADLQAMVVQVGVLYPVDDDAVHAVGEHGRDRRAQHGTVRDAWAGSRTRQERASPGGPRAVRDAELTPVSQQAVVFDGIDNPHQVARREGGADEPADLAVSILARQRVIGALCPEPAEGHVRGVTEDGAAQETRVAFRGRGVARKGHRVAGSAKGWSVQKRFWEQEMAKTYRVSQEMRSW